jgi:hypothetical protein
MEAFAVIIPTRDRPKMLEFCKEQLSHQTIQPAVVFIDITPPSGPEPDLVRRIKLGVQTIKNHGIDFVFIIEDDDLYPKTYFETIIKFATAGVDFVGYGDTYYYSLKSKTWRHQYHHTREHNGPRASLFCTAFRISALAKFCWPADHTMDLDIRLWNYARDHNMSRWMLENNPTLGIKGHGEGKTVMKSHNLTFEHQDFDLNFLERRCEPYQFQFYKRWMKL